MLIEFFITGCFNDKRDDCLLPLARSLFDRLTTDVDVCPSPDEPIALTVDGFCIMATEIDRYFSYDAPADGKEGKAYYTYNLGGIDIVEYGDKYEETIRELKEKERLSRLDWEKLRK